MCGVAAGRQSSRAPCLVHSRLQERPRRVCSSVGAQNHPTLGRVSRARCAAQGGRGPSPPSPGTPPSAFQAMVGDMDSESRRSLRGGGAAPTGSASSRGLGVSDCTRPLSSGHEPGASSGSGSGSCGASMACVHVAPVRRPSSSDTLNLGSQRPGGDTGRRGLGTGSRG